VRRRPGSAARRDKLKRMSATPSPAAGQPTGSATEPIYQERLWPNFWVWLIAAGVSGAVIFVLAPISLTTGYIAAVVTALILGFLLFISTPRITVTGRTLQVGRAQIEREFIGAVEGFRGDAAVEQRGPKLNATAYQCIRGWISPVVKIEITDEADRTPYWLTSTRRPEQLVAALGQPSQSLQ
jgi:hypothetical protein